MTNYHFHVPFLDAEVSVLLVDDHTADEMKFSIIEYLAKIELRLTNVDEVRRLAFALWCSFRLWDEFSKSLPIGIGSERTGKLSAVLDALWNHVIRRQRPAKAMLISAKAIYQDLESSETELEARSEREGFGMLELLGSIQKSLVVFENGSVTSAVGCAQHIINWRDYELAFVHEIKDPLSHPDLLTEVQRQIDMISYLENSLPITDADKFRFRT